MQMLKMIELISQPSQVSYATANYFIMNKVDVVGSGVGVGGRIRARAFNWMHEGEGGV